MTFQGVVQIPLDERDRQVASRLLDQAPGDVGRAPEVHRDRIGVVHRHEEAVHVLERPEHALSLLHVADPQQVEDVPPALADRFGHPVQVGGIPHRERIGRGKLLSGDQGVGQVRLRVLLFGIEQVAGEADVRMRGDPARAFVERRS